MKRILTTTSILLLTIFLAACGTQAATEAPQTQPEVVSPTEAISQPTEEISSPTAESAPVTEEAVATEAPATEAASSTGVSFANDVYPIFQASCVECHGVKSTKEGLDMLTYENLMIGSRQGPVLVPGNASESLLVQLIVNGEMPNRGALLTSDQIQIITDWINQGALNN